MKGMRPRLAGISVAILSVHMFVATSGILRACWEVEHTHAGMATDCSMHQHPDVPVAEHVHQSHHGASSPAGDGQRVACGCSNDPLSLYIGPPAVTAAYASLAPFLQGATMMVPMYPSPADGWFPPASPPPRPVSSLLI
jgi:hypothetical protein